MWQHLFVCSANVWQSRHGAESCQLRVITHARDRKVPRGCFGKSRVTSFRFFCLVYLQISLLIKSAKAWLKSLANVSSKAGDAVLCVSVLCNCVECFAQLLESHLSEEGVGGNYV